MRQKVVKRCEECKMCVIQCTSVRMEKHSHFGKFSRLREKYLRKIEKYFFQFFAEIYYFSILFIWVTQSIQLSCNIL